MIFFQVLRGKGFRTTVQEPVKTQAKIHIQTVDTWEHTFLFNVMFSVAFLVLSASLFRLHDFILTVRGHHSEMQSHENVHTSCGAAVTETH